MYDTLGQMIETVMKDMNNVVRNLENISSVTHDITKWQV